MTPLFILNVMEGKSLHVRLHKGAMMPKVASAGCKGEGAGAE